MTFPFGHLMCSKKASVDFRLQGDVGPFKPGLPLEVPLWMATHLRQRQKCRILQPEWMDPEVLEDLEIPEDLEGGPGELKVLFTTNLKI